METQGQEGGGVIHFSCQHCLMSLTVDDALAGITGPCPSCGEAITAPPPVSPPELDLEPDKSVAKTDVSPTETRPSPDKQEPRPSRRRTGGRSHDPETGMSEARRERAEVAAVFRLLVAGLVVLAIVLAVAYWLKTPPG